MDECSLLRDYIDVELPQLPPPGSILLSPSSIFVLILNETVPTFLELLESTPSLFGNLTQAIEDVVGRIFDPGADDELAALAAEFVAVANVSCGISLSPEQIDDVSGQLFDRTLVTFFLFLPDCDALNQTVVEQVVAAANGSADPFSLGTELIGIQVELLANRVNNVAGMLLFDPPADILAAAQTGLDEFLFFVNDFCGIPTLSDVTIDQLNVYFLVDLVNAANNQ